MRRFGVNETPAVTVHFHHLVQVAREDQFLEHDPLLPVITRVVPDVKGEAELLLDQGVRHGHNFEHVDCGAHLGGPVVVKSSSLVLCQDRFHFHLVLVDQFH